MLKHIPADPSVSVTTQNTVNGYHLAHRKVYAPFPMGVIEPMAVMGWSNRIWEGFWTFVHTGYMAPTITHDRYADYVVLDLKRPWFVIDKGCDWLYGACRNEEMAAKFLRLVDETRQRYDAVFERDGFMILRRKSCVDLSPATAPEDRGSVSLVPTGVGAITSSGTSIKHLCL